MYHVHSKYWEKKWRLNYLITSTLTGITHEINCCFVLFFVVGFCFPRFFFVFSESRTQPSQQVMDGSQKRRMSRGACENAQVYMNTRYTVTRVKENTLHFVRPTSLASLEYIDLWRHDGQTGQTFLISDRLYECLEVVQYALPIYVGIKDILFQESRNRFPSYFSGRVCPNWKKMIDP